MISVLILTKNEERDLPGALASVAWSDDIHVVDSHSTDRTVEIAKEFGACQAIPSQNRTIPIFDRGTKTPPKLDFNKDAKPNGFHLPRFSD